MITLITLIAMIRKVKKNGGGTIHLDRLVIPLGLDLMIIVGIVEILFPSCGSLNGVLNGHCELE